MDHPIPVVDIEPFLAGADGAEAAAGIERAATEVGFFQVVGHGVPAHLLDRVYAAAHEFSRMDVAFKEQFRSPHPYRGVHLRPDRHGALRFERFLAARFDDPAAAVAAGIEPHLADYYHPNVWPTAPESFRPAVTALFERTQQLAGSLMRLFSLALGLGPDGFDGVIEPNASSFAVNHYRGRGDGPAPEPGEEPEVLFHEHADGNTLTLLHQRGDYEGLQVNRLDAPDRWIPVPVRDDAFVVNFGKLMNRWTNDHWGATRHRVVAAEDPSHERTTLTTFHMPALTTVIAPLAAFVGPDGPHHPPITAYESEKASIRNYALPRTDAVLLDPAVAAFAAET